MPAKTARRQFPAFRILATHYTAAKRLHPDFPGGAEGLAIMTEEYLELVRAANDGEGPVREIEEAAHVAAQIVRFYIRNGIRFFLFGPSLSIFSCSAGQVSYLITGCSIRYDNGAEVATGFVHNLEPEIVAESCPELRRLIEEQNTINAKKDKKSVRKLSLPDEVITSARLQYMANHDTVYRVQRSECQFIRKLDHLPSGIFGGGFLLSPRAAAERAAAERAAAERAAAERVPLSDRERAIQRQIGLCPSAPSGKGEPE